VQPLDHGQGLQVGWTHLVQALASFPQCPRLGYRIHLTPRLFSGGFMASADLISCKIRPTDEDEFKRKPEQDVYTLTQIVRDLKSVDDLGAGDA
jgi:hypothetical protein